jgi:hypothetical protein
MVKRKTSGKTLLGAIALLGIATGALPLTIYRLKETASMSMSMRMSMPMACYNACISAALIGAAVALVALVSLFVKNAKWNAPASVLLFVGGVAAITIPKLHGYCVHEAMACRTITEPTLLALGVAIAVLSAIKLAGAITDIRRIPKDETR